MAVENTNNNNNQSLWQKAMTRLRIVVAVGEWMTLIINVVKATLRRPPHVNLIMQQLYDIGVASLPVVAITGFSTGLVLAAQSIYQLSDKGLTSVTGLMVTKAMMTELGPVLTAFMVTGRVGAAMCAELGTMLVTEQIDALQTMAVNPNRYLHRPSLYRGDSHDAAAHDLQHCHGDFWRLFDLRLLFRHGRRTPT